MAYVPRALRRKLIAAARQRCEYCQTSQKLSGSQMHIEHINPESLGGASDETNLCYSCAWCNSYKGTTTQAIDVETNQIVPLFNPRQQHWNEHFAWSEDGLTVVGLTPSGRVTVRVLRLNHDLIVDARRFWAEAGRHPPTD